MKMDMDCRDMGTCFTASKSVKHLLFKGWHITSIGDMIGSMVAAFMFAVIYEGLKAGVVHHYNKPPSNGEEHASLVSNEQKITPSKQMGLFGFKRHIIKTMIYVLNIVYAYVLMLVAMSYNVWLFLALVLGLGFGYFFSQPLFQSFVVPTKSKQFKSYGATKPSSGTI